MTAAKCRKIGWVKRSMKSWIENIAMQENRFVNATALALVAVAFFFARSELLLCHAWTQTKSKSDQDSKNGAQEKDPKLTQSIQIIVGQGDLITLKEDVLEIKLANPAIAGFVTISKRRIRLVGKQAGLTELSVKTQPNGIYRYKVEIVAPADRAKIKKEKKFDEIIAIASGQERLLTLTKDLEGGIETVIALGDPSIADFKVLDPRQIQVIAKKAGLTDLQVIYSKGEVFHYEIKVTAPAD